MTEDTEEWSDMEKAVERQSRLCRGRTGRLAAAAFAVAGTLTTLVLADGAGAASSHASKSVVVSTAKNSVLGTYLVSGRTLYTLNKSGCNAACLKYWPALQLPKGVRKATAGPGVTASMLGTVKMANGALQVTYGGKPLYWFYKDTGPGQVKGNDTKDQWGLWKIVVTAKPQSSGSGGTTTPTTSPTTTVPSGGGTSF